VGGRARKMLVICHTSAVQQRPATTSDYDIMKMTFNIISQRYRFSHTTNHKH